MPTSDYYDHNNNALMNYIISFSRFLDMLSKYFSKYHVHCVICNIKLILVMTSKILKKLNITSTCTAVPVIVYILLIHSMPEDWLLQKASDSLRFGSSSCITR